MITVFFRTLLIYLFLLGTMRFLGKRQVGELQLSELITTLMLSELAVMPIADGDVPLVYALLPILTLLSLEVIVSYATAKWVPLRKFLIGSPKSSGSAPGSFWPSFAKRTWQISARCDTPFWRITESSLYFPTQRIRP